MTTQVGYLLHFDRPFDHARHYMSSAVRLQQRLDDHRNGHGARLMFWVAQAGHQLAADQDLVRRPPATASAEGPRWALAPLPDLPTAATAGEVPVVIEVLPVGSPVPCACPRFLIAERITGHITRRPDGGGIQFPPAARHVALRVDHRPDCPATTNHEHYNVCVGTDSEGLDVNRCSCGLERSATAVAAEIRARCQTRAAS